MKKPSIQASLRRLQESGFTLIEVMVSVGISGIVMLVFASLLSQSATFSSFFNRTASSIEGAADTIENLNSILPQVVSIRSCRCRGATNTNLLSNCYWDDSTPWYDPVRDGGANDSASTGFLILAGDFEFFYGGSNLANTTQLFRSNIAASNLASNLGGCNSYTSLPAAQLRGCKVSFNLNYKAPTVESGSTPSNSGFIFLRLGSGAKGYQYIGEDDRDGRGGVGVSEMSCGFVNTLGGSTGLLFALNIKLKSRSTFIQTVSHTNYESWHPSGKNYDRGLFKEIRLKHSFRNLDTRGVYQWRVQSQRSCLENGKTSSTKEQCCSLALTGGACSSCVPSGSAGTADNCCSEKVSAGTCI